MAGLNKERKIETIKKRKKTNYGISAREKSMKEIKAFIKPHMLSNVVMELSKYEGLSGLSVTKVQGFGRSRAKNSRHRIVEDMIDYVPHVKLEIVCRDACVDGIVACIEKTARTGLPGDGKIFISAIETAVRISTGERDEAAV
jgi:nitrogen regulatory protein PII